MRRTAAETGWRCRLIGLLALAGIGVSGYLTWTHLTNQAVACGQSPDCDIVQQSAYSEVAGVPVALFGLLAYVALAGLAFAYGRLSEALAEYVPLGLFGISLAGVLYSAYLTYLELFVIRAICRWCVASAAILTLILVLSALELRTSQT
jgi:uncharacterized membrane protein